MKLLNGREMADYIKERQAKEVRRLRQSLDVHPGLAIVHESNDPAIAVYMRLKERYGSDIGVRVNIHRSDPASTKPLIQELNGDPAMHGIIAQLPLQPGSDVPGVLNAVSPNKDVDGLGENAGWDPAAPTAILWLLAGYGVELAGKQVALVGEGRLVGGPLVRMLKNSGVEPIVFNRGNQSTLPEQLPEMDVVISATGQPGLITPKMLKTGAVVVDAGTSSEGGAIKGDLAGEVYQRDDLIITPQKGGVGPLTVCALFDNVLRAARGQHGEPS